MKSARPFASPRGLLALLVALAAGPATAQEADDDDFELPNLGPGLVATYTAADGARAVRRDESLNFDWRGRSADPRLPAGDFSVVWRGKLFALEPGQYRLHVHAEGDVTLRLAGRTLLDGPVEPAGWIDCPPVELDYGYHPLEVAFRAVGPEARFGLYWSGPRFQLEPVGQRHLFHDPQQDPGRQFEQGRLLARRLACAACHNVPGEPPPPPAAALTHLAGNVSRTWLAAWLRGAGAGHASRQAPLGETETGERPGRIMPLFALNAAEAEAMADHLLGSSEQPRAAPGLPRGDGDSGGRLFRTLGCLACHTSAGLGSDGLFGGGDLSTVGDKRPADFFKRWLHDPASVNPAHRMPMFKLSDLERADLAAYLVTLKSSGDRQAAGRSATNRTVAAGEPQVGRRLVERHRCGACHALPSEQGPRPGPSAVSPSKLLAERGAGCLGGAEASGRHPGYHLPPSQQAELRTYFEGIASIDAQPGEPQLDGQLVLAERNCLSCHARGLAEGITSRLAAVVEAHPELTPVLPAMSPPSLSGVGDKLDESALADAIALRNGALRRWLSVRMPRYDLSAGEMKALVDYFVEADRVPSRAETEQPGTDSEALALAGARLVTSDGFGCTSCHQIGNVVPSGVALAAQGTDLSLLSRRVRQPWFDRWVRNPARIVPRMEMPAVQQPVRGVLGDSLDDQLAAIWQVLSQPGFNPPPPNPIRVVRARNVPEAREPAAVLSDVLEMDGQVFVKPLAIGLPNRHNLLVDLAANRLAGWWIGDTARQRTRGKSWYWEAGGTNLLAALHGGSELVLVQGEEPIEPVAEQQFLAQLDWYEQVDRGVRFGYRLHFATPGGEDSITVSVTQTITASHRPGEPAVAGGLRRRIEIAGLPPGTRARLQLAEANDFEVAADGSSIRLPGRPGQARIGLIEPGEIAVAGHRPCVALAAADGRQTVSCELEYLTTLPLDRFPFEPPDFEPPQPARLEVVPGYEAIRLPLPADEMPTGLTWRDDGTLVFSSLKGSVWLARDTDGDGLEDRQTLFADGLAAPYGVAAHGDAVDVITKHGLVRLRDRAAGGRADRMEVAAGGWGHTADYHDWAVGLERDLAGNYYIALPCQQDERSAEAAYLRGTAIKLAPRQPTPDDPRSYGLEVLCAGLRFPMGLALNRRGDLFATDNQGNYNPFNELNHLVKGARYGFINKLESRAGFNPPFRDPAIDIPHPWTRSVNGICFLYTPPALADQDSPRFGPFEGHLIGCEYDTRRLVRMSLELVDGVYQGAVYPFSLEPGELETFEGPVVCQVAPGGDLYVGNLRDSGWGAGQNTGSIVRLKPHGPLPAGIAEVRARSRGFELVFTAPVRRPAAERVDSYAISSYRKMP
ncbi:MAG: c-type cytochrome, partial [Pirellulales bacterium]